MEHEEIALKSALLVEKAKKYSLDIYTQLHYINNSEESEPVQLESTRILIEDYIQSNPSLISGENNGFTSP